MAKKKPAEKKAPKKSASEKIKVPDVELPGVSKKVRDQVLKRMAGAAATHKGTQAEFSRWCKVTAAGAVRGHAEPQKG